MYSNKINSNVELKSTNPHLELISCLSIHRPANVATNMLFNCKLTSTQMNIVFCTKPNTQTQKS